MAREEPPWVTCPYDAIDDQKLAQGDLEGLLGIAKEARIRRVHFGEPLALRQSTIMGYFRRKRWCDMKGALSRICPSYLVRFEPQIDGDLVVVHLCKSLSPRIRLVRTSTESGIESRGESLETREDLVQKKETPASRGGGGKVERLRKASRTKIQIEPAPEPLQKIEAALLASDHLNLDKLKKWAWWQKQVNLHSDIDIPEEIAKADAWADDHPERDMKSPKGFMHHWLEKAEQPRLDPGGMTYEERQNYRASLREQEAAHERDKAAYAQISAEVAPILALAVKPVPERKSDAELNDYRLATIRELRRLP